MGRTGETPGADGVCCGRECGADAEESLETVVVEGPEATVVVDKAPLVETEVERAAGPALQKNLMSYF